MSYGLIHCCLERLADVCVHSILNIKPLSPANKQRFIERFLSAGKRECKSQVHFLTVSTVLPQKTLEGPSYIDEQLEGLAVKVISTYTLARAGHFVCRDLVKLFNFSWGVL